MIDKPHSVRLETASSLEALAIIYLGCMSPYTSCSLPETIGRNLEDEQPPIQRILSLLGLAPDGGCLAATITGCAGGLLHHLFTLTR